MTRVVVVGMALGCALAAAAAPLLAHHGPSVLGSVRIAQPVLVEGTLVQPGTYEVRLTGEHMEPLPGQSEDAAQQFELVRDGTVVARDFAEVMPGQPAPVGTSGGAGEPRVEMLRGGEFLRISAVRGGERYLIHLPVSQ